MRKNKLQAGRAFITNEGSVATVIRYDSYNHVIAHLDNNPKNIVDVTVQNLQVGSIKNPLYPSIFGRGFKGIGDFSFSKNGQLTTEYQTWKSMFERCYSKQNPRQAYADCEVDPRWFDFQEFAKWYTSQDFYDQPDYHLDKDLLIRGNKVYSPDACVLLPAFINKVIASCVGNNQRTSDSDYLGVGKYKKTGKFKASISMNSKNVTLGIFKTAQEAHRAYVLAKESYLKKITIEHIGRIDKRVFDALMSWRVNPAEIKFIKSSGNAVNDLSIHRLEVV